MRHQEGSPAHSGKSVLMGASRGEGLQLVLQTRNTLFNTREKKCTAKLPLVYLVTQLARKKATHVLENKQKIAWKLLT